MHLCILLLNAQAAHTRTSSSDATASSSATAASPAPQHAQQAASKEEEEERRGLVCMVCKEGYASRPKELLAAYCYCMKLHTGEGLGAVPELWRGSTSPRPGALQASVVVSALKCCSEPYVDLAF